MFQGHGAVIAGKAGYAVGCFLAAIVLVVSGFAYYVKGQFNALGGSNVLAGGPSVGAMNILLMGLESRNYMDGRPLPRGLEDAMHIGSKGGEATNTLILIHIFAGGQKAVGFSIPRDDYVQLYGTLGFDGITHDKIDAAYAYAMAAKENQVVAQHPGISSAQENFLGNEAGRLAAVQTVEALTGVKIDHFAELNLFGFYEMAQAFGGVEVCLKHRAYDPTYSGLNLSPGYHHLNGAQTLAFVRQRHGLPNEDLDRTHRQQAVIDYVIWKLKHENVLSDVGQISAMLGVAKQYMITSSGWNLEQFAGEMQALSGSNLTFKTLKITGQTTLPGAGAVNTVDPADIKRIVHNAFYAPPVPQKSAVKKSAGKPAKKPATSLAPSATTVDVYNGSGVHLLAAQLSQALASRAGFKAGTVGNIPAQSSTEVLYGTGAAASAAKIAGYFTGITATASSAVAPGHVEVRLGTDTTSVPSGISASSPSPSSSSTAGVPAAELQGNGAAGGAVTVKANTPYGTPCVD